jgi:DNA-binding transcriptional LysR family regulator
VNSLPAIELLDRELGADKLSCNVSSRVSSVLVGLLLALNSDALLTVPASLASILERQFGLARIQPPLGPIAFPLRLMWHSSYERDECHEWVRGEFAHLAREMGSVG